MLRLCYPLLEQALDFNEGEVRVLVIENPIAFRTFIHEVKLLVNSEISQVGISKDFECVAIAKHVEVIFSAMDLEFDNRKLLNKIYSDLSKEAVGEELYIKTAQFKKSTIEYLDELLFQSDIALEFQEIDTETLLKAANVKVEIVEHELLENICNYMNLYQHYFGIQTFIFFNLKAILDETELEKLYEFCQYQKFSLLLCEAMNKNKIKGEKVTIIDYDLCQIC